MTDSATTVEAARAAGGDLRSLSVRDSWEEPWNEVIGEFEHLEELVLGKGVDLDPAAVTQWPPSLEHVCMTVIEPTVDLEAWAKALPGLRRLTVWGPTTADGSWFDALPLWADLETLTLKCGGLRTLPDSIPQCASLKHLTIQRQAMGSFPEQLCELTGLQSLVFDQPFRGMSDALAHLSELRVLDLSNGLNATMDADDVPPEQLHPLPDVIAKLPALEELKLGQCGIHDRDTAKLQGMSTLRVLDLQFAGITNLDFAQQLPELRTLLLDYCYRIRSLNGLAGTSIEHLSLGSNHYIKDISGIREMPALKVLNLRQCAIPNLEPAFTHPTLETLVTSDSEVEERWLQKGRLRAVTPETIRDGLASADGTVVEDALRNLADWSKQNSGSRGNPCYELFGVEKPESGLVEVPLLSRAVGQSEVASDVLARVVEATFREMDDALAPTAQAVEIIVEREDVEAQKLVADAFVKASEYYDGGHRAWDGGLQDQFIDDLFPRFHADALAELIPQLQADQLNGTHGDQMDALIPLAFDGASSETTHKMTQWVKGYIDDVREYTDGAVLGALVEDIARVNAEAAASLEDELAALRVVTEWSEKLAAAHADGASADDAGAALQEVLRALETGQLAESHVLGFDKRMKWTLDRATSLSCDVAEKLVNLAFRLGEEGTWVERSLIVPIAEGGRLGAQPAERRDTFATELKRMVERAGSTEEANTILQALSELLGESPEQLRMQLANERLQRAMERPFRGDLEPALDAFLANPSAAVVDSHANSMLARHLEDLHAYEAWKDLGRLCDKLRQARPHLEWSDVRQQYCLSYPLVAAITLGREFYDQHVAPWLEGMEIVEPRFAFNLACYQAQTGTEDALVEAVERAIDLGKPKEQFLVDPDFAPHLAKPRMLAILS